jgi:hypothetical protein
MMTLRWMDDAAMDGMMLQDDSNVGQSPIGTQAKKKKEPTRKQHVAIITILSLIREKIRP